MRIVHSGRLAVFGILLAAIFVVHTVAPAHAADAPSAPEPYYK